MRRGRFTLILAIALAALQFLLEWLASRQLDALVENPGDWASWAATMIMPYLAPLLWISVGMLIALTIGYWHLIVPRLRIAAVWVPGLFWLFLDSFRRKKVMQGGTWLSAGQWRAET